MKFHLPHLPHLLPRAPGEVHYLPPEEVSPAQITVHGPFASRRSLDMAGDHPGHAYGEDDQ